MSSVWMINHYATDPSESASGSRHFSLAKYLARAGWNATIIAASTEHPSGRQRISTKARQMDRIVDDVRFRFLSAPEYRGNGLVRIVNIVVFTARLLLPSGTRGLPEPEVVVGSTVHPLAAWAASVLARRRGVPFVFEIRDLWPQTLIDMNKIRSSSAIARLLRSMERMLCRRASVIVTLLPFASQYLAERGVPREKIVWVSNGCDATDFIHSPRTDAAGDEFVFMYFGSIGLANGVEDIVRAFAPLAGDTKLVVYGGGPSLPDVREVVRELQIDHAVDFRGIIPKAEVPEAASLADALVINVLDLAVYRHGISMNKLFDYLAAARPVVIASSAPNNPVADAGAGVTAPSGDPAEFTRAMRAVRLSSPAQRAAWGENGRRLVEDEYDYEVLGRRFADALVAATSQYAKVP